MVLISLILASLCYVRCSFAVSNFADEDRFTRLVLMLNMLASAVVTVLLFILVRWLPGSLAISIPAAGLSIICIVLNLAHKYIYLIDDENYYPNQLRQILLLGLVGLFFFVAGYRCHRVPPVDGEAGSFGGRRPKWKKNFTLRIKH